MFGIYTQFGLSSNYFSVSSPTSLDGESFQLDLLS